MDTSALVQACIAGDRAAQQELFRAYREGVLRLVWRLLGGRCADDIEDAIQEVYVAFFRSLPSWRGACSLETWLCRVGTRVCMTQLRRRYRRSERVALRASPQVLAAVADAADSPQVQAESAEAAAQVHAALERLAPERRTALVLYEMEGRSLEEIAAAMGSSVGTVKSRLFRGRRELAALLATGVGRE